VYTRGQYTGYFGINPCRLRCGLCLIARLARGTWRRGGWSIDAPVQALAGPRHDRSREAQAIGIKGLSKNVINQVCRDGRLQDLHHTRLAEGAAGWVVKAVRSNAQDMPREGKLGPPIQVFQVRMPVQASMRGIAYKPYVAVSRCPIMPPPPRRPHPSARSPWAPPIVLHHRLPRAWALLSAMSGFVAFSRS